MLQNLFLLLLKLRGIDLIFLCADSCLLAFSRGYLDAAASWVLLWQQIIAQSGLRTRRRPFFLVRLVLILR